MKAFGVQAQDTFQNTESDAISKKDFFSGYLRVNEQTLTHVVF